MVPDHLSKAQDIPLKPGDRVRVGTPGGGGYGDPFERDPELGGGGGGVAEDVRLGRYTVDEARDLFAVALGADGTLKEAETAMLRTRKDGALDMQAASV